MSVESARIISAISGRKNISRSLMLGTITNTSPLTLKVDNLGYEILSEVLKNADMTEFNYGDRVLTAAINNTCYVVICKVV